MHIGVTVTLVLVLSPNIWCDSDSSDGDSSAGDSSSDMSSEGNGITQRIEQLEDEIHILKNGLKLDVLRLAVTTRLDFFRDEILMFQTVEDETGLVHDLDDGDPMLPNFHFDNRAYIVTSPGHYFINLFAEIEPELSSVNGATGDFTVFVEREGDAPVPLGSLQLVPTIPPRENHRIFAAVKLQTGDKILVRESGPLNEGADGFGTSVTEATLEVFKIGLHTF